MYSSVLTPPHLGGGELRGCSEEDADSEQGVRLDKGGLGRSGRLGGGCERAGAPGWGSFLCPQRPSVQMFQGPFSAVPAWMGGRAGAKGLGAGGVGLAEEGKVLAKVVGLPGPWEPSK